MVLYFGYWSDWSIIGRLSFKQWCYWLWRLVISNWCVSIRLLSQLNSRLLSIRNLTRQAQLFCDSPDSLQDETDYLNNVFSKKNYNTDFVRRNTPSNTNSNTQTNSGPVTSATIPYIRGTSETIARILQPYNIRVAHKPITTLRRLLTNVKDKKTNRRTDREQYTRSNAATAGRLTLVKPAET